MVTTSMTMYRRAPYQCASSFGKNPVGTRAAENPFELLLTGLEILQAFVPSISGLEILLRSSMADYTGAI